MSTRKKSPRLLRAEGLIRRRLSEIIYREINDPRLGSVTITHVDLASDYSLAKVYITSFDDKPGAIKQKLAVLHHASKFLRGMLAQAIELRYTPELRFVHDESLQRAQHMTDLLDKLPGASADSDAPEDEADEET